MFLPWLSRLGPLLCLLFLSGTFLYCIYSFSVIWEKVKTGLKYTSSNSGWLFKEQIPGRLHVNANGCITKHWAKWHYIKIAGWYHSLVVGYYKWSCKYLRIRWNPISSQYAESFGHFSRNHDNSCSGLVLSKIELN